MNFKFIHLVLAMALLPAGLPLHRNVSTSEIARNEVGRAPTQSKVHKVTGLPATTLDNPRSLRGMTVVTWTGNQDHRWTNPRNWDAGRVPRASDIARFSARSNSAADLNEHAPYTVAGLLMESDYRGEITLNTNLTILNDLVLDRKSTRLNSSHIQKSRMPSSA